MSNWSEGIESAIAYIEENLTGELEIEKIAAKAYVSPFHFQRIFNVLCGFTVGEYIRNRRLTLAAQELSADGARVIDVAIKYGYDSPDSFARAFTKFHGVSPMAAKGRGAELKSFVPLRIKLTLEGGSMIEYKIVEKAAFTVMGVSRRFSFDKSYSEIPKFWDEHFSNGESKKVGGTYGLCIDNTEKDFEYLIADDYIPWKEIPEGCVTRSLPAGTWAVFPCRGPMTATLQSTNTKIWNEWLPNCKEYKLGGNYNIELYTPPAEKPEDDYCEIWVPVVKA